MTDTDKVKLINHVVADIREYGDCGDVAYLNGVMDAIGSICDFEEKNNA